MVKVSVARCSDYDLSKVTAAIQRSLEDIGFTIPKGKIILLKPNVLSQSPKEAAVTTHPVILDALCTVFQGNQIWIGDSGRITAYGGTKKAFEISGIEAVAKKHQARLISFEGSTKVEIIDEKNIVLKKFTAAKEPFMADLMINVPKLKTHMLTRYTGAVKNMFGCIPGAGKSKKHAMAPTEESFSNLLLDIYTHITPHLTVMDGIVGLEGNGPGSDGNPKKAAIILASQDGIALDMVASRIIGYDPTSILTNKLAIERKLISPDSIEIIGEKYVNVDFKKPQRASSFVKKLPKGLMQLIFNLATLNPQVYKKRCRKCGVCVDVCPKKAVLLKPYPRFDRKKCILCYCCHENCPYNAISLKKNILLRAYQKIKGT